MHKYYHSHKGKFAEIRKRWLARNPCAVIGDRDLSCVRAALRSRSERSRKAVWLLGCSIAKFVEHLECLWDPGMNWENYGSEWTLDRIRSMSSFDLSQYTERHACCHYLNVRPLWKRDRKPNKTKIDPPSSPLASLETLKLPPDKRGSSLVTGSSRSYALFCEKRRASKRSHGKNA